MAAQFADRVQRDLEVYRNDDNVWQFDAMLYVDGTVVDLTDATILAQIKNSADSTVVLANMDCAALGDPTEGVVEAVLHAADADLSFTGGTTGVYDIEVTLSNTEIHTPYFGDVSQVEDVTQAP